jgi:hypothetical protein
VAACLILAQFVPSFEMHHNLPSHSTGKFRPIEGEGVAGLNQPCGKIKATLAGLA